MAGGEWSFPDILCAPFLEGASEREIYLPEGNWYDFNTNKKYEGARKYTIRMSLDEIPMFVKEGTVLPLAHPVEFITPQTVFEITCRTYGSNLRETELFEDDGFTFGFEGGQAVSGAGPAASFGYAGHFLQEKEKGIRQLSVRLKGRAGSPAQMLDVELIYWVYDEFPVVRKQL